MEWHGVESGIKWLGVCFLEESCCCLGKHLDDEGRSALVSTMVLFPEVGSILGTNGLASKVSLIFLFVSSLLSCFSLLSDTRLKSAMSPWLRMPKLSSTEAETSQEETTSGVEIVIVVFRLCWAN